LSTILVYDNWENLSTVLDEKRLIERARIGDTRAFNQLVVVYQGLAYNVAYRVLGDEDAAADATQEAFLNAFKALKSYRGGSFRAWLLRIVTNACYDQLRLKQRRPTVSLEDLLPHPDLPETPATFSNDGESPEDYSLRQELARHIEAGLQTLPTDQRIVLILADIQGLSYEEVASVADAPLGTVKSRLNRARARLRDYLLAQEELLPAKYRLMRDA